MGIDPTFANDLLKLIANGTAIAHLADNAASTPYTSFWWALHSADPTGGNQTTSEVGYTSYARLEALRTSSGLLVLGSNVSPATGLTFAVPSGAAGAVATYISLGAASSGAGRLFWSGPLLPAITIEIGNAPLVAASSSIGVV